MGRSRWRWWPRIAATIFGAAAVLSPDPALADDSLQGFVDLYRCEILRRIDFIRDHGRGRKHGNYLVVDMARHPPGIPQTYAQCLFTHDMKQMFCEAASGYYLDEGPRTAYLPRDSVMALAGLGFSTDDSKGNFQKMASAASEEDRGAIADLMLKTLYLAFGARRNDLIRVSVPLLSENNVPMRPRLCVPIS